MKRLIAFDLDDTLATTKQPITPRIAKLLVELSDHYMIAVITGGTHTQIKSDVIERLKPAGVKLERFYFMPTNGLQLYHFDVQNGTWDHKKFAQDFTEEENSNIQTVLKSAAEQLGYWITDPKGDLIELRGTQVTYSALGQKASPESKYAWDPTYAKRFKLHKLVSAQLPDYKVQINGNTSVDVTKPGFDKGFGLTCLLKELDMHISDVLYFGDQFQETGNDYPVLKLGVDTVNVANWEETAEGIEDLLAKAKDLKASESELHALVDRLRNLRPDSREDTVRQSLDALKDNSPELLDRHNTTAFIIKFIVDSIWYCAKIEFGDTDVVRGEIAWYESTPASLRQHHVVSYIGSNYAFVVLRWLNNAKTVDEIAREREDETDFQETTNLIIKVLEQDAELFDLNPKIELENSPEHSFFYDKYYAYNSKADAFPYLKTLLGQKTIVINGQKLLGPDAVVERIQKDDKLREYLSPKTAGLIHGDSHLGNLLVEGDQVFMIDPKGMDPLPLEYDTGRVLWTLTGWNAILSGEYECTQQDGGYVLEYRKYNQYVGCTPAIRATFTDHEYHRAMYSSAMQYLTRIAHAADASETTALYLRGLQQLQELFDELGERS